MHDLLRIADLGADELVDLLELAQRAKTDRNAFAGVARGTAVAVLFEKPSLRTRFSVEVALTRVGAHPVGAYDREVGLGSREPVEDAARVLDGYVDAIVMRTFDQARLETLADVAAVPVVNALSDQHHPLQALADLLTVADGVCGGDVRGLKDVRIAWIGDGNNVAHSLIEACARTGTELALACPAGHEPDAAIVEQARADGATVTVGSDPAAAAAGAQVVSTDVWASMGQEDEAADRRAAFAAFTVTQDLMQTAAPGAVFLHCLPAHRGEEVAAEVIDGPASRVWEQAHNRLHTATAVFVRLLGGA